MHPSNEAKGTVAAQAQRLSFFKFSPEVNLGHSLQPKHDQASQSSLTHSTLQTQGSLLGHGLSVTCQ